MKSSEYGIISHYAVNGPNISWLVVPKVPESLRRWAVPAVELLLWTGVGLILWTGVGLMLWTGVELLLWTGVVLVLWTGVELVLLWTGDGLVTVEL
jgi:hypothetical protein